MVLEALTRSGINQLLKVKKLKKVKDCGSPNAMSPDESALFILWHLLADLHASTVETNNPFVKETELESLKRIVQDVKININKENAEPKWKRWLEKDDKRQKMWNERTKKRRDPREVATKKLAEVVGALSRVYGEEVALLLAEIPKAELYFQYPLCRFRVLSIVADPDHGRYNQADTVTSNSAPVNPHENLDYGKNTRSPSAPATHEQQLDEREDTQGPIEPGSHQEQRPNLNHRDTRSSSSIITGNTGKHTHPAIEVGTLEKGKRPLSDDTGYPPAKRTRVPEKPAYYLPCGYVKPGSFLTLPVPSPSEKGQTQPWNTYHAMRFIVAIFKHFGTEPQPQRYDEHNHYSYYEFPADRPGVLRELAKEMPEMGELRAQAERGEDCIAKLIVTMPWPLSTEQDSILHVVTV
ncbi:hypothetical protein EJ07DRAFT_156246 [Lizonia empirigonia]|nr:hypothetical protein EJ07DRAFT_156246 [Lizonia empirigonia]